MSDISTVWSVSHGDWLLAGVSLKSGPDIQTAVLISLFTDRQAELDDPLLDGSSDRRGWWGDAGSDRIGSRLWLLERSKRTQQTLVLAQTYIEESLQWLIDDGVAAAFDVQVEWQTPNTLAAKVVARKSDGTNEAMNFSWAWAGGS